MANDPRSLGGSWIGGHWKAASVRGRLIFRPVLRVVSSPLQVHHDVGDDGQRVDLLAVMFVGERLSLTYTKNKL